MFFEQPCKYQQISPHVKENQVELHQLHEVERVCVKHLLHKRCNDRYVHLEILNNADKKN